MRRRMNSFILIAGLILVGCHADSGVIWRDNRFALQWTDTYDTMALCYQTSDDSYVTVVDSVVFSVGSDQRYIVAMQHPDGKRNLTNYFIVQKTYDGAIQNPKGTILGPLTEAEFRAQVQELKLPSFSKTVDALK